MPTDEEFLRQDARGAGGKASRRGETRQAIQTAPYDRTGRDRPGGRQSEVSQGWWSTLLRYATSLFWAPEKKEQAVQTDKDLALEEEKSGEATAESRGNAACTPWSA